ncbi:anti-sigma-F factor Fin family protein [Thalassobacillus sp. CUG 92003]|uniref:anti-sigma-F factor Fin family protein n=1 Tax=Thalassobacillus sp. CUG 92003 TaxID=2736641 RepID=UPI0015E782EE|nr:anti-sigma-F factor Fin family protein [Thalassobacillus sp. CUG 92003]
MSIIYVCRHCQQTVGELNHYDTDTSRLGLERLSAEDHREMVEYHGNGDISIRITCEDCEQALTDHPQYHELDFFIQ